jgi:hypothetical protein
MSVVDIIRRSRAFPRIAFLATSLIAVSFWPQSGTAQSIGPFAKFDGNWRGSGQVTGSDGGQERISCRASYSIPPSGAALSQSLVCASDSYRFQVQSDVVVTDGHSVQGRWQETTRSATGDLVGQVADDQFRGTVTGPGFTAEISIRMAGAKQAVTITPHGSNITKVDIVMSRNG